MSEGKQEKLVNGLQELYENSGLTDGEFLNVTAQVPAQVSIRNNIRKKLFVKGMNHAYIIVDRLMR